MTRERIVKIFSLMGLAVAVLSALEMHLPWLASLCGYLGDGCRDAQAYTLFNVQLAYLGIGFYVLLSGVAFFMPGQVFWPVMIGLGGELVLAGIMVNQHFFCVFCTLNLAVVIILSAAAFRRAAFWQSLSAALIGFLLFNAFVSQPGDPGAHGGEENEGIAAIVAGEPITHKEVDARIAGRLYTLKREIFLLKRGQLEARLQDRLLSLEAGQAGITPEELAARVYAEAPAVRPEDVADYYRENQASLSALKEAPEVIRNKVVAYLDSRNKQEAMQAYLLPLMKKYEVQDLYGPPALPSANVDIHNNFAMGPEESPVTIVEFSDYLCPMCRKAHPVSRKVREHYRERVRWIFKDYPLQRHKGAKYLAAAARCAGEQGKFWEFQDLLYASGKTDLTRDDVMAMAKNLGLDMERFAQSLDSGRFIADVEQDLADVRKAGVNATPTFIINGKLHPGSLSFEAFSDLIDSLLENPETAQP